MCTLVDPQIGEKGSLPVDDRISQGSGAVTGIKEMLQYCVNNLVWFYEYCIIVRNRPIILIFLKWNSTVIHQNFQQFSYIPFTAMVSTVED